MSAKKNTMSAKKKEAPALKFVKGGVYMDHSDRLWHCPNAKVRKTDDGHESVLMQATESGEPTGEPAEAYIDTFARQLTKAELKEYREVCQREREAQAEANGGAEAEPAKVEKKKAKAKGNATPKAKATAAKTDGKLSALDAAAKVLAESREPMTTKEMIEVMAAKGYWTSPGGLTPAATLYSAILRELQKKGEEARFEKTDRGHFKVRGAEAKHAKTAKKKGGKAKAAEADATQNAE